MWLLASRNLLFCGQFKNHFSRRTSNSSTNMPKNGMFFDFQLHIRTFDSLAFVYLPQPYSLPIYLYRESQWFWVLEWRAPGRYLGFPWMPMHNFEHQILNFLATTPHCVAIMDHAKTQKFCRNIYSSVLRRKPNCAQQCAWNRFLFAISWRHCFHFCAVYDILLTWCKSYTRSNLHYFW